MEYKKFPWLHPGVQDSENNKFEPRFCAFLIFDLDYNTVEKLCTYIVKAIKFSKRLCGGGPEYFENLKPCIHITKDETHPGLPENSYVVILHNITNNISRRIISHVLQRGVDEYGLNIGLID